MFDEEEWEEFQRQEQKEIEFDNEHPFNQITAGAKYVVVSLFGQNAEWYRCFDNKTDAEHELNSEHYEFGERELMTLDEFIKEYVYREEDWAEEQPEEINNDAGFTLAKDGTILDPWEWNERVDGYIHFPKGK